MSYLEAELAVMIRAARAAATIALEVRAESAVDAARLGVEMKGPDDPVTRADKLANASIVQALAGAFPGHGVVAEESAQGAAEIEELVRRERVFFVDPIDGTREYAEGRGDYAVMIGLAVRGKAAAGVLLLPAEDWLLAGVVGRGLQSFRGAATVGEAAVIGSRSAPETATVMVSRSHRSPDLGKVLAQLGGPKERPSGSVGVKAARVAVGEADLYVHPGSGAKKWDACGPEAIVVAAGGAFGDVFGAPIDYAAPDLVLRRGLCAGNAALFAAATAAAREVLGGST